MNHAYKSLNFAYIICFWLLCLVVPLQAADQKDDFTQAMAALEQVSGGRLGAALLNTASGRVLSYRGDERFPFASTFKLVLTGALLKKSEDNPQLLNKIIRYTQSDLVEWSPRTEKYIEQGMSLGALAAAAIQYSDNTAANLLLHELGGPTGLTAFARSIGDNVFSLDRMEPELNSGLPGDTRDTTSPLAMAHTVQILAFGKILQQQSQQQLIAWMEGNTTGAAAIRAGLPKEWRVGDKTGAGAYGTTNNVAIIWPSHGQAYILALYFTQPEQQAPSRKDVLAKAAQIAAQYMTVSSR